MEYLLFSMVLFIFGIYGLLTKRKIIKLLISIELIAAAAAINFVYFPFPGNPLGQALMIITLSVGTCLTAIVLAIAITTHQKELGLTLLELFTGKANIKSEKRLKSETSSSEEEN
ncbi:MAG: NADH-quinone oxidoreductase subunit NuoK [Candidatus Ranarchaeia archaeon]